MRRETRDGKLSRRQALALGAGAAGAAWLGGGLGPLPARAAERSGDGGLAPAGGVLKRRITARTIDVHSHILGNPTLGEIPAPSLAPFKTTAKISDEERKKAQSFLTRFKHDMLTFDTPQQEDEILGRYVANEGRGRTGTLEANAAHFIAEMDEAGIDTAVVLFMDFAAPPLSKGPATADTTAAIKNLEALARIARHFPGRFINFAGIDVRRGAAGVPLLEKAVKEYGFAGCGEIVTTLWQTPTDDKEHVYPYLEAAQGLGIPVMMDCTMSLGFTQPYMYDKVATDFPKLRIGLGGAGIRVAPVEEGGKTVAATRAILEIAEKHPNLYLDLDDWQVADAAGARHYLGHLRRALDGPARHRISYGSDYPVFSWMYTEKGWVDFILDHMATGDIKFTDEEIDLFFSGNALGYLGIRG